MEQQNENTETKRRGASQLKRGLGLFTAFVLFISISSCKDVQETEVIITHLEKETTKWGCISTDTRTWIEDVDTGRIDYSCGKLGVVGDTINGYWVDHLGRNLDGFTYQKP